MARVTRGGGTFVSPSMEPQNESRQRFLTLAAVSATVLVVSVIIANILGELPEALWLLLVPIGMWAAGIACATFLVKALAPRLRR